MSGTTRLEIFKQAAFRLRSEFEALRVVPHNALRGGEAERIVREFLSAHIPKRFAVGSGFILDPNGQVSRQTDVVIYDAFNCPVYRASDDAAIFPSSNVAVVVEVKSTLDKAELADAFAKIAAVKKLSKIAGEPPKPLKAQTVGFVFAFDSNTSLTTIVKNYEELLIKEGIGHHIDVIVILDVGVVMLAARVPPMPGWSQTFVEAVPKNVEGAHIAISASKFDEYTLDAFMRLLIPNLVLFRPVVDHPGFGFRDMPEDKQEAMLSYLFSTTTETEPQKRDERLRAYGAEITAEFAAKAAPPGWGGKSKREDDKSK